MKWINVAERMPEEYKYESDTLQGHHEWMESKPVLAWDSMYGACIDSTRNGKWRSETSGGYQGQAIHGIVAWMPVPEYDEEEMMGRLIRKQVTNRAMDWLKNHPYNPMGNLTYSAYLEDFMLHMEEEI